MQSLAGPMLLQLYVCGILSQCDVKNHDSMRDSHLLHVSQQAKLNGCTLRAHGNGPKAPKGAQEGANPSKVCFEGLQDAHKATVQKAFKGRKRRFAPLETKHTVTSAVWLPDSNVVASSGEGKINRQIQYQCMGPHRIATLHDTPG